MDVVNITKLDLAVSVIVLSVLIASSVQSIEGSIQKGTSIIYDKPSRVKSVGASYFSKHLLILEASIGKEANHGLTWSPYRSTCLLVIVR